MGSGLRARPGVRVLVLGGGGREHALCWALARSSSVDAVLCAPGNAGIAAVASVRAADPGDPGAVVRLARDEDADLVVVGPEAPLVAGVADALRAAGVPVFGPSAAAARIESSKAFAKQVLLAADVPTARHWVGSDPSAARAALDGFSPPYVVKADGLAAGKGVRICRERTEAVEAVDAALLGGVFGQAGETIVLEEYLEGPELSVFALCDGERAVRLLPGARDYKRAFDGDAGPNTGGMGAYCPVADALDPAVWGAVERAMHRTVEELARRGRPYVGVLYGGFVLTREGPKILEFNARFGDPEAQVVLPLLRADLGRTLFEAARGRLAGVEPVSWEPGGGCVTVVLASGGYPGSYETGKHIRGLDAASAVPGAIVFHAGTSSVAGEVVTAGGRVLAVSGCGASVAEARATAYRAADCISFAGLHRRNDIAAEASPLAPS
jgi:phosphoribosylamine---glycine ligase